MATKPDLKELGDFLNPVLGVPIGGKIYRIQAMTAQNALIIEESMAKAKNKDGTLDPSLIQLATEDDAETYMKRLLGDSYEEMLNGGVSLHAIRHIVGIVFAWTFSGFETAQEYFRSGEKSTTEASGSQAENGDPDPYGRGYYDPLTGLSDYYDYPAGHGRGNSWHDILTHWAAIEADFQDHYTIDLSSGILNERSWQWFTTRITGLLTKPARIEELTPSDPMRGGGRKHEVPVTRLGMALKPPVTE